MDDQASSTPPLASVLILDSDAQSRTAASQMLHQMGHAVLSAANLTEARDILRHLPIQLVFSEMNLSGESGLDLLHELAPRSPDVAVVMMTRDPDPQTLLDCLRSGAFEWLFKPLTPRDLSQAVARVLARQRAMQAHAHALHDVLTGLPNRTLLMDRFAQAVAHSNGTHRKLAVAFVDLDNFKQINDTQGHEVGDQVLIAAARRLSQAVREGDTVARWGGDEMILLLSSIQGRNIRTVCERLKDRVQQQLTKEDGFFVTMSMGVAVFPDDAEDPEQLLQSADAALLLAKNRARNEVIFFGDFEELKSFRKKTQIRGLLTSAVTERRIQVHYQPIVEAKTGRTVGAEALARWHEEGHGWLPPNLFIPMAETMGLIENLGRQVLEQAFRHMEHCHRQGHALRLSVNLSLRQLLRSDFTKDMLELAEQCALKPEQLILEMTESQALLGLNSEAEQMEKLSAAGFSLSLDDFGQGYSSLASLHDMPVRELKIDMKFMQHLHTKKGRRIVKTIVALSHTLGLETVAEGVDTQEQWTILKELGVQRLQGYLFSRPLPAEEFLAFLQNQTLTATPSV
jgi:diguanylate cyclase (GGDEF)-like protein